MERLEDVPDFKSDGSPIASQVSDPEKLLEIALAPSDNQIVAQVVERPARLNLR
jgi:hypothetical protein